MTPVTERVIERFFESYLLKHYKKGHIFLLPEEPIDHIYYLVEGRIKIYDVSYRGDEIIINSRKAPGFLPLSLITTSAVNRYIYEAASDVTIRQAPIEAVEEFLNSHPKVVLEMLSYVYTILDTVLERMVHFIASSARHRLLYALVIECREFGVHERDQRYSIAITEKELGARAGLSRETVSREAALLKKSHLIEVSRQSVIIRDLRKLEKMLAGRR